MRVIFVTSKINLESAGGSVADLDLKARDMQKLGGNVKVITVFSELNRLENIPYPVIEEKIPTPRTLMRVQWNIFKVLRLYESHADVFHIEGQFSYGGALYRLSGGKPVVAFYNRETFAWHLDGTIRRFVRHYVEKFLNRFLTTRIDHFLFTTPQLADRYAEFGLHLPSQKVTVQPDYVDLEKIAAGDTLQSKKSKNDVVRLFASGRMIKDKGFHILIEAMGLLKKELLSRISLTISGAGPERENLIREAGGLGLSSVIQFPGWTPKERMYQTLAASDIFIYPSFHLELSSVLLLEAMTLGVPSIVPRGGGLEWVLGEGGETFENNNANELAHAIETLVESHEARRHRSDGALVRMQEFDHHRMAKKLFDILQQSVQS